MSRGSYWSFGHLVLNSPFRYARQGDLVVHGGVHPNSSDMDLDPSKPCFDIFTCHVVRNQESPLVGLS